MTSEKIFELSEKADLLYRFGCLLNEGALKNKDYGSCEEMSMTGAHILKNIEEHPGITITELSKGWRKTKGAISQTVAKLETDGYIEKKRSSQNTKHILLYPTSKGKNFCITHMLSDAGKMLDMMEKVGQVHSMEEIETYFKVMKTWKEVAHGNSAES